MKLKIPLPVMVLLFATIFLIQGCSESSPSIIPTIVGVVSTDDIHDPNDPDRLSEIQWAFLPGGGVQALYAGHSYFVLLKVKNTTDRSFKGGVTAHLRSATSSILQVKMVRESPLVPASTTYFHFDTDGYGEYLWMSQADVSKSEEYELFITLQSDNGKELHFVGTLPTVKALYSSGNQPVSFVASTTVPDIFGIKPVQKDQWPQVTSVLPGPPAVLRKQGSETAIYFYYSDKWNR